MLRRGVPINNSGIPPEGLGIPNVANREVLRPAGRKIANNIAEFFDNVAFPTVDASVSESSDRIWTGVSQKHTEYSNCNNWNDVGSGAADAGYIYGVVGQLNMNAQTRLGHGFLSCTLTYKLLCASY